MEPIERQIASITEDRRASYLFNTKTAADAVGCHPNKFNDWWQRTRGKLVDLCLLQPGQTAAEMLGIIAQAEALRAQGLRAEALKASDASRKVS